MKSSIRRISLEVFCQRVNAHIRDQTDLLSEFLPHVEKSCENSSSSSSTSPPPTKKIKKKDEPPTKKLIVLFSNYYSQVIEYAKRDGEDKALQFRTLYRRLAEGGRDAMYFALAAFQLLQDRMGEGSENRLIGRWYEEMVAKTKTEEEIISTADLENVCLAVINILIRINFDLDPPNLDRATLAKLNEGLEFSSDLTIAEMGLLLLNRVMSGELPDVEELQLLPPDDREYLYEPISEHLFVPVYYRHGKEIAAKDFMGHNFEKEVDCLDDPPRSLFLVALPANDEKFFQRMAISCVIANCVSEFYKDDWRFGALRRALPCQLVLDDETRRVFAELGTREGGTPEYFTHTYHDSDDLATFTTACIALYARMLLYVNPNLSIEKETVSPEETIPTVMDLLTTNENQFFALLPLPFRKEGVNEKDAISRINKLSLQFIINNGLFDDYGDGIDDFADAVFEVERFTDDKDLVISGAKLLSLILGEGVVSGDKDFVLYNGKRDEVKEYLAKFLATVPKSDIQQLFGQ